MDAGSVKGAHLQVDRVAEVFVDKAQQSTHLPPVQVQAGKPQPPLELVVAAHRHRHSYIMRSGDRPVGYVHSSRPCSTTKDYESSDGVPERAVAIDVKLLEGSQQEVVPQRRLLLGHEPLQPQEHILHKTRA